MVVLFGAARGFDAVHSLTDMLGVLSLAVIASIPRVGRHVRSTTAALGLVACSALLVHFWDAQIERTSTSSSSCRS